jgi:Na+-transporting methylmalonyl-CoA/oxaloacetate decarboxylase gamma subunit
MDAFTIIIIGVVSVFVLIVLFYFADLIINYKPTKKEPNEEKPKEDEAEEKEDENTDAMTVINNYYGSGDEKQSLSEDLEKLINAANKSAKENTVQKEQKMEAKTDLTTGAKRGMAFDRMRKYRESRNYTEYNTNYDDRRDDELFQKFDRGQVSEADFSEYKKIIALLPPKYTDDDEN